MKTFHWAIPVLITLLIGCAQSSKLETYRYAGIDLGTSVNGPMVERTDCYVIVSEIGEFRATFPSGSVVSSEGIQLPSENTGQLLRFGSSYRFNGGFNNDADRKGDPLECPSRSFIVNSVGNP